MRSPRSIAIAAFTVAFACPALAEAPTIDTYTTWDKNTVAASFGCPDATTFGQVITVPSGLHHLDKFTFWVRSNITGVSESTMVARAYVYRWDAIHSAVQYGARYESPPRTISFGDMLFHPETFTPAIPVTPGMQYVIFASIDREYVDCKNGVLAWGLQDTDVYPGGSWVFQNNAGDDLQWPTAWTTSGGDLAFKAYLSP